MRTHNHYRNTSSRWAIAARADFRCVWCGRGDLRFEATRGEADELQVDHLTPRSGAGSNRASNLVCSCGPCNMSRQATPWKVWVHVVSSRTGEAATDITARVRGERRREVSRWLGRRTRDAYKAGGHVAARAAIAATRWSRWQG